MKKKILVSVLILALLLTGAVSAAAAIDFPDLPAGHWAYDAVQQLVAEGTVSGTPEGYYEPDRQVTRAEFVRMIGRTDLRRDTDFADVPQDFWGYEDVMYSGVEPDANNCFRPEDVMTRGDVIDLLWKRAGSPAGIQAPAIVTDQGRNRDAVAWIYMYGVMIGDDGIHLRLEDGISRAEVASLILRARAIEPSAKPKEFASLVSDQLLEKIFNGVHLFDSAYAPGKTITNGELCRAALRLAGEEYEINYSRFSATKPFEHEYAADLAVIGQECLGEKAVNAAFADKPANRQDVIAALTFGVLAKSHAGQTAPSGSATYEGLKDPAVQAKGPLAFAYQNHIVIGSGREIGAEQPATMREIAAVLLQLDNAVGTQTSVVIPADHEEITMRDLQLSYDVNAYPETERYYQCILAEVPTQVYLPPFFTNKQGYREDDDRFNPIGLYDFARSYASMFVARLNQETKRIRDELGIDVQFTFYPALAENSYYGLVCRLKMEVKNMNGKSGTYQQFFLPEEEGGDCPLYNGSVLYFDVNMDYLLSSAPEEPVRYGKLLFTEK